MNNPTMRGKQCVITGGNSGIGKATALALADLGANIILVCRDEAKGEAAVADIQRRSNNKAISLINADLASLESVRELAATLNDRLDQLDVLINNAGVMCEKRATSVDGFELQWAVNHLAPLLLTRLLQAPLARAKGRVVNVSSQVHRMGLIQFDDLQWQQKYKMFKSYGQSKLALIMCSNKLSEAWQPLGITINCLHPGVIATNLGGTPKLMKLFLSGPDKGARTSVFLASSAEVEGITGGYFLNCKASKPSAATKNEADLERLWTISSEMIGLPEALDSAVAA
ncbi:MAG: SDR family oxidoreductase [Immundisolibacteraceae bacterium]|nr:SDR family oxidoreductase [Immundisolibacteraceae bacterium]